jgi:DNA-binding response OmpR family regulator
VHGIVTQSGGSIWVYSEKGHGTRFKIFLPRVEAQPLEPAAAGFQPALGGSETILLVEDDDAIRLLARRMLDAQGYVVLEASDGQAAIEIADTHNGSIDLLITDVVLPNRPGVEVAAEVTKRRPGTRVLYVSGYTANTLRHQGLSDDRLPFLEKPFTVGRLAAKVRELLDAPAAPVNTRAR